MITVGLTLVLYFFLLLVVSRFIGKGKGDNDVFFSGGHNSPWYLVGFGMIGASVSGVSFVSVPGMVGSSQMTYLQMCIGFFFGYLIVAFTLLPLYYRMKLTSIYQYLEERFSLSAYRTGALFFIISKMAGAAARFYLVCLILQQFVFDALGVPFVAVAIITLLLIWLYTKGGGISTLVWTDSLQTLCLLLALVLITINAANALGLDFSQTISAIKNNEMSRVFVFGDFISRQNFLKQFLSGVFIVIVMTGLDQDMMQKNLTCKNLRQAQKSMCSYGICFIPVNMLFLALGILLTMLSEQTGMAGVSGDKLLPSLISSGVLGNIGLILFTLGVVAAAFSSADSALTALTTSFCIDILRIEKKKEGEELCCDSKKKLLIRRQVHLSMIVFFILFTLVFKAIGSNSVIDAIYIMASYTYGPLLGLFAFGLFTKHNPKGWSVPIVATVSPLFCYAVKEIVQSTTGYEAGYELLIFNGALTFAGLFFFREKKK